MTTATLSGFPTDARPAVDIYLTKGLAPIPLPHKSKEPSDWSRYHLPVPLVPLSHLAELPLE